MTSRTGRFITLEGIDGAGKSTHATLLAARIAAGGHVVVATREPGGTTLGEKLRALILHEPMTRDSETLLMFAARREHLDLVIRPALARGDWVLCDRFTDATFAYQGGGRGFDLGVLRTLEQWVQAGRQPDLTLWFDVPAGLAAERRAQARAADRFEGEDLAFFERVAEGYRQRIAAAPQRFVRIDGARPLDEVQRAVLAAVGLEP
jgi:dTMP kinase